MTDEHMSPEQFEVEWRAEIAKRVQEVRDGKVELEPWSEVLREAREARARQRALASEKP